MTQQLDLPQHPITDDALHRLDDRRLPKAREVRGRRVLQPVLPADDQPSRHDVGHELVLPERAP